MLDEALTERITILPITRGPVRKDKTEKVGVGPTFLLLGEFYVVKKIEERYRIVRGAVYVKSKTGLTSSTAASAIHHFHARIL